MQEDVIMSDLGNSLKVALADTFVLMVKALGCHWNVEGPNFKEYHELFGMIYEDLWSAVDPLAEKIRTLDEYAPGSLKRFLELTTLEEDVKIPTASMMMERLYAANEQVIQSVQAALEQAQLAKDEGVVNFLGERLESHTKFRWFLKATGKKERA